MPRVKSDEQPQPTEEPIENSVEVNEVEPTKEEEEIQKPKRPKREKSPAQIAAWDKLQIANKKKFEEQNKTLDIEYFAMSNQYKAKK